MTIDPDGQHRTGSDLAATLKKLRIAAGLSGERLAVRCAMSQSKISRIERGKLLPSIVDVERILLALEVPPEVGQRLISLARRAHVEHTSWRAVAELGLWRKQTELKVLAETCQIQRSFLPIMPSGLLQIPEYARVALSPTIPGSPSRDVDKAVAARLDRQTVLDDTTREFRFLMTEQAVKWRRVERAVMAAQCAHLAGTSERPNVEIAVIPLAAQVPGAPLNTFLVFDERLVIVELFSGEVVLRDYRDVKHHIDLYEFFRGYALTGDRARDFLLSARDEFA